MSRKKIFFLSSSLLSFSLFFFLTFGCGKSEPESKKNGHFKGEKKKPFTAPVILFNKLLVSDTVAVGDSATLVYGFTNTGFETAIISRVVSFESACKCQWPDSVKGGKTGQVVARCAWPVAGPQRGSFEVQHNTQQAKHVLNFGCLVLKKN